MAKNNSQTPSPLTFDLPVSLIGKLHAQQKRGGLKSASETVRVAISSFDFEGYKSDAEEHRQISVRLPADLKAKLVRASRKKKVSVGELLRAAIDDLELKAAKAGRK